MVVYVCNIQPYPLISLTKGWFLILLEPLMSLARTCTAGFFWATDSARYCKDFLILSSTFMFKKKKKNYENLNFPWKARVGPMHMVVFSVLLGVIFLL